MQQIYEWLEEKVESELGSNSTMRSFWFVLSVLAWLEGISDRAMPITQLTRPITQMADFVHFLCPPPTAAET